MWGGDYSISEEAVANYHELIDINENLLTKTVVDRIEADFDWWTNTDDGETILIPNTIDVFGIHTTDGYLCIDVPSICSDVKKLKRILSKQIKVLESVGITVEVQFGYLSEYS